jgi:putative FmdB family regulatory protein
MSPTYSYYCQNCKTTTEEMFSMKNKPDTLTCIHCGKVSHSIIDNQNGRGFILKGHGWSFDGYAGKSNFKFGGSDEE